MKNKNRFELIIYGRGGQGVKSMAEILALAGSLEGKFVQAFPEFGPERSGAPVKAYFRISDQPIRTRESIVDPDAVVVLEEGLMEKIDVFSGVEGRDPLVVNTKKTKHQLLDVFRKKANFITIDAGAIALATIGENRPNVVMLGRFVFATEAVKLKSLKEAFEKKYGKKLSPEKIAANLLAMDKGYDIH